MIFGKKIQYNKLVLKKKIPHKSIVSLAFAELLEHSSYWTWHPPLGFLNPSLQLRRGGAFKTGREGGVVQLLIASTITNFPDFYQFPTHNPAVQWQPPPPPGGN